MNKARRLTTGKIEFLFSTVLLGTLTGCVGYVDGPRGGGEYAGPPPAYVESQVVVEPNYVYYPGYEVYYSRNTRQYVYQDGRSWVSRPAPPRVSAEVLLGSPSVGLNFQDHPSNHHGTVARQYPKNWAPPAQSHRNQGG